jgi:uncharacterized protein (TIGR03435 family)
MCLWGVVLFLLAGPGDLKPADLEIGSATVLAQGATPLAFEAASVKTGVIPSWSRGVQVTPGRFMSTDMPLMSLIIRAYGLPGWKIKNAPDWVKTEPFTVQAIFPASSTPAQMNAMLRTLLEQRFRLSVQLETREMDTDVLILSNRDGQLGPGMHPVDVDCETKQLREGSAPGLFAPEKRPPCKAVMISVRFSPGDLTSMQTSSRQRYAALTMTDLADALSASRERPVLDRTDVSGQFDVDLDYARQTAPAAALDPRVAASTPDSAPSLPVALEQQLGLKLRRERNRVELMNVRSVERPRPEEN